VDRESSFPGSNRLTRTSNCWRCAVVEVAAGACGICHFDQEAVGWCAAACQPGPGEDQEQAGCDGAGEWLSRTMTPKATASAGER
jgi:hypothetical protein